MPKTAIVIVNWNGWKDTIECLSSVLRAGGPGCETIVIDNDSQDGSVAKIMQWAARGEEGAAFSSAVRKSVPVVLYDRETAERGGQGSSVAPLVIIETEKNLGFAGGNNIGIRYALARGADYVLLLNNDAALRGQDPVATLVSFMERTPKAGACGGRLFFPDGTAQQSYGNFPSVPRTLAYLFPVHRLLPGFLRKMIRRSNVVPDASLREPLRIDYPSGAFFLVRARTVREVGMLDERYFMYVEETDWCYRMMQKGWGRYYVPQAEAMHKVAGSFRAAPSGMHAYFIESLFRYYEKHFPRRAQRTVFAAFWARAVCAAAGWRIAARLLPERSRATAAERAEHWTNIRNTSVSAMRMLRGRPEPQPEVAIRS